MSAFEGFLKDFESRPDLEKGYKNDIKRTAGSQLAQGLSTA